MAKKPEKLYAALNEMLTASSGEKRWYEVKEREPESILAFKGEYWTDKAKKPDVATSTNEMYLIWCAFAPYLLHEMPRPFSLGAEGQQAYADCCNLLSAYANETF